VKEDEGNGEGKGRHSERLVKATTLGLRTKSGLRPNSRYKPAYIHEGRYLTKKASTTSTSTSNESRPKYSTILGYELLGMSKKLGDGS
jgi:hypothetical protein